MKPTRTNRRDLLALGGSGVLASLLGSTSGAQDTAVEPSSLEQENERLVNDFCESWSTIDIDKIVDFLDDKIVYQMFEGMPDIKGKEAFQKRIQPFFANIKRIQWDISRSHVVGNLVINQRVDNFYRKDDKSDMHFPVAGFFVVKKGKIQVWRDYAMPKPAENDAE